MKINYSGNIFYLLLNLFIVIISGCKQTGVTTMFRGNPQHSGLFDTDPLLKMNGLKWKFKTGGPVFSSPVIAGDLLYEGSNDSCLYAIDKNSGSIRWKFKTAGPIASTPAISGQVVYFVSFDGNLYALDAFSGKNIWFFNGGAEHYFTAPGIHGLNPRDSLMEDPWDVYLSSPVISNDRIYFGSGNGNFYSVDLNTGKEIWHVTTRGIIHNSPAIYKNMVFFGGWDTYMHAVDINTGKEIWNFKTGSDTIYYNQTGIQSSPMIHDGILYFGCRDAYVYALDAGTGHLRWKKFNNFSWVNNTPVVKDSIVYYGTSDSHKFIGLNAYSGDSLFALDLNSYIFSSPVIAGSMLYVGDQSGTVYGIDYEKRNVQWEFHTDGSRQNAHGLLNEDASMNIDIAREYFKTGPTYNNYLKYIKDLYSLGSVLSTPAVDSGVVYFGSTGGYIYAVQ